MGDNNGKNHFQDPVQAMLAEKQSSAPNEPTPAPQAKDNSNDTLQGYGVVAEAPPKREEPPAPAEEPPAPPPTEGNVGLEIDPDDKELQDFTLKRPSSTIPVVTGEDETNQKSEENFSPPPLITENNEGNFSKDDTESSEEEVPQPTGKLRVPLGQLLVDKGLISHDQLDLALKIQRDSEERRMLGSVLVKLGFITESALGEVLTEHSHVEHFSPKTSIIDPNLVKQVPKNIVERYKAVPILLQEGQVYIAMVDIYDVLAIDHMQRYFPRKLKLIPVHCSETDLQDILDKYFDYELSIDGILRELEALQNDPDSLSKLTDAQENYTNPTVRLLDALLVDALHNNASDIHFEPEGVFVRLRYRVDGKLRLIRSFHKDYWPAIVVRIKILSGMNITETRMPQDGRITKTILGREVSFRVATQPTIHGENVVLRILDTQKALVPMDVLGYSEHNLKLLEKAIKRPEGIIVVTGPTGSGKTTTLYSILNHINKPDVNIMTLEDPVEYELSMIRQSMIREGSGMSFAGGIKSILRQDPDIIFIGEVRDADTATMAVRAAMTGHQVYTSLHTNDALGAIPRLLDIGVTSRIISGNLICCIAQRLARKLCDKCKTEHKPTESECKILGISPLDMPKIYKHTGCEACFYSGYKGRVAISEVILVDDELDELIYRGASRAEMLRHIKSQGFKSMPDDGIQKVLAGTTDIDELIRTVNIISRL